MSVYVREDLVLQYIWHIVIVKCMLPGQPPVYTGLCGNGMQFCLQMSRLHEDFADGCTCVRIGRSHRFHPKNVIQRNRYYSGSVMIWDKIGYYDK
jgi:hypothetical protein